MTKPITIEIFFLAINSWKEKMQKELAVVLRTHPMPSYWNWQSRRQVFKDQATVSMSASDRPRRGLALAQKLLEQREQIEAWIVLTGKAQGEERHTDAFLCTGDWDALIDAFAPEYRGKYRQLPYYGDVNEQLHRVLDQLALGRQIRPYDY